MSQKASQRVSPIEADDDVDMEEGTSTQPTQVSQGNRALKVRHLARHLLHASTNEKDGALKDALAQKMHFLSRGEYFHVLREASGVLERSFGCKVIHRNNQSHIVRTQRIEGDHPEDTMAQAKRGLLSAILMFIFVSKSKKSNSGLGVCYDTPDPVFGDIRKLISPSHTAEFIHEGYISFAKSSDRFETQTFTYDWGPRALLICEPKDILKSFCTIVKDDDIDMWTDQQETVNFVEEEKKESVTKSEQYMQGEK
ncbi:MAGE family protein [Ancylostoma duodenale]|uniref:MAGE family protein n=1 Tax=Ancylostoma duodenale TaxID=51022 RepID=A0A0C2CT90_9BILA|nr:MAGE family protein [Ancylostoma duodenale]